MNEIVTILHFGAPEIELPWVFTTETLFRKSGMGGISFGSLLLSSAFGVAGSEEAGYGISVISVGGIPDPASSIPAPDPLPEP